MCNVTNKRKCYIWFSLLVSGCLMLKYHRLLKILGNIEKYMDKLSQDDAYLDIVFEMVTLGPNA